jgi:ubiquinone/menaquinone biosynthesis C-methylase UbiE
VSPLESDKVFAGSVPKLYAQYMVPMLFEPYAADLVARLAARRPERILEVAAGTGVVTRAMLAGLPEASIVATDLNPGMIDEARATPTARPVEWRVADAMALPFADASFDTVVCQFGAMFFPDRSRAFAEMRRVLAPGGELLFNVWDRIEANEFTDLVVQALARLFPADPPRFLARTPHGYFDRQVIAADVATAGFNSPSLETVTAMSRAASARDVALALCQGTNMRGEIEARDPSGLERATRTAELAIAERFGQGPIEARMAAIVVTAEKF